MKKSVLANLIILIVTAVLMSGGLNAQTSKDIKMNRKTAQEWVDSRVWANGLKLNVHNSANIQEFAYQYQKNKPYWDKAFAYLKNTDLEALAPGRYNIDEGNVYAIVSEGPAKAVEEAKWESHRNFIDIQHVIRGKEKMGIAPLSKAKVTEPYNDAKDIAFHSVPDKAGKYYIAEPGTFLIFFTGDAHRPAIRVEGSDVVKKVVIKIRTAQ